MKEIEEAYKTYNIGVTTETQFDLDELIGMFQQIQALAFGYDAMDFTVQIVDEPEEIVKVWTWTKNDDVKAGV